MSEKKMVSLALMTIMLAIPMLVNSVKATEWVEVARFYRNADRLDETTENFTCNHMDWRITWLYHPWEGGSVFRITIYRTDTNEVITEINDDYRYILTKTGERYISGNNGTFYLKISAVNIAYYYEIVIEQDLDSIPEFPLFLILPLFMMVTLLSVLICRRKHSVKASSV